MKRLALALILILSMSAISGCISSGSGTAVPETSEAPTTEAPTTTPAPTTQPPTTTSPPPYLVDEDGDGLLDWTDVSIDANDEVCMQFIEENGILHLSENNNLIACFGNEGKYGDFIQKNRDRPVIATLFEDHTLENGFENWLFHQLFENSSMVHDFNLLTDEKLELLELIYQTANSTPASKEENTVAAMRALCQGIIDHYFEYYEGYTRVMQLKPTSEEECPVALYLRGEVVRIVEKGGELIVQVSFVDLTEDTDTLYGEYINNQNSDADVYNMVEEYYLPNFDKFDCVKDNVYTNYINSIEGISTGIDWGNKWFDCSLECKDDVEYVGNEQNWYMKAKLNPGLYLELTDFVDTGVYDDFEFGITKDESEIYIGEEPVRYPSFNYDSNIFLHASYENFESSEFSIYDSNIFFDENDQLRISMYVSPLLDKQIYYSKEILSHYLSDCRYEFYASLETLYLLLYG